LKTGPDTREAPCAFGRIGPCYALPRGVEAPRSTPLLALAAALVTVGCGDKAGPGPSEAIFPATFRQTGFRMVRPCRAPGEHWALNGFTVWVDQASADLYDELLRGNTARGREMPDGSMVVKELYVDRGCSPDAVDHCGDAGSCRGFGAARGMDYLCTAP
jgi:hypothetical protein